MFSAAGGVVLDTSSEGVAAGEGPRQGRLPRDEAIVPPCPRGRSGMSDNVTGPPAGSAGTSVAREGGAGEAAPCRAKPRADDARRMTRATER